MDMTKLQKETERLAVIIGFIAGVIFCIVKTKLGG